MASSDDAGPGANLLAGRDGPRKSSDERPVTMTKTLMENSKR
ncbi:MAG: hypothetical protein QOE15_2972, partial [Acidimicrobiaceae bacterium]|nr:hypothetical protein [Acidimicrobiaceae bacterium]